MTFPGVKALDHVDFTLRKGEIHALMGENGAGKSTLIKCLTGVNNFEAGEIHIDGISEAVRNRNTLDAQKHGISTVYQEVNLCPNLSVAENLFIGREPMTKLHTVNRKEMVKRAQKLMNEMNLPVDVTRNLDEYSLALQQMIAIARAVDMECKVLILDEPTSSLDDSEVEKLFNLMRQLRNRGVGIIFVTHFLEQVYAVCDRITVLRNGQLVGEYPIAELPRVKLIAAMMGKDFDDLASIKPEGGLHGGTESLIDARGLSHAGKIKPFDLTLARGEVIGLTGLLGSGRSELARAIYGADKAQTGTLRVKGKEVHIKHPIDAMNLGMGMLPDDRKAEGIIGDLSVRENIILAMQARRGMTKLIPMKEQEEIADHFIELLQIKTASRETPVKQLSGGNQQKVIIAREVENNKDLLIAVNPTRGLDVGAIEYVHKYIVEQRNKGNAVLLVSFELDEIMSLSDRIDVIYAGQIVSEVAGKDANENELGLMMAGGGKNG